MSMVKYIKIGNSSRPIAATYDADGNEISDYAKSANVYTKTDADKTFMGINDAYKKAETYPQKDLYTRTEAIAAFMGINDAYKKAETDEKLKDYYKKDETYPQNELYTKDEAIAAFMGIKAAYTIEEVNAKLKDYLTISDAESTYVKDSNLSTEYVKWDAANDTYLTLTDAEDYYNKNDVDTTFLKQDDASNTYLKQNDASSTYLTQINAESIYLTKEYAAGIDGYLSKADANTDWLNKENVVTINGESLFGPGNLVIKADKEKTMEFRDDESQLQLGQPDLEGYTHVRIIITASPVSSVKDIGLFSFNNKTIDLASHTFFGPGAEFDFYNNLCIITNNIGDKLIHKVVDESTGDNSLTSVLIKAPTGMKFSFLIYKELITIKTNGGEE